MVEFPRHNNSSLPIYLTQYDPSDSPRISLWFQDASEQLQTRRRFSSHPDEVYYSSRWHSVEVLVAVLNLLKRHKSSS